MHSHSPDACFVISPFGEPFDTYFTHVIKPAIESCGLYAIRGDSLYRPTTIVDDIWTEIQDAKLLIAELTGRNPNVFYELGLAHAISKPVVLLSESIEDVPFDLRGIRVLLYDKTHPEWGMLLRKNLTKSIQEVLQNPGTAIPTTFKIPVQPNPPEESETLIRIEALEAAMKRIAADAEGRSVFSLGESEDEPAAQATPSFRVGEHVLHRIFGKGEVLEIEGDHKDERVRVNFDRVGVKWISQRVARMEVLSK